MTTERETLELRVNEAEAGEAFEPDEGVLLPGGDVRKITLSLKDERLERIGQRYKQLRQQGRFLFFGWDIQRRYSDMELAAAELFLLLPMAVFEPSGEECGTVYDESTTCRLCGAGARQTSELRLEVRRIPKRADIARTLGDEVIVSSRLARAMQEHGISGVGFRPVWRASRNGTVSKEWHQLVVTAPPVDLAPRTVTGNNPFDLDEGGRQRCPQGHVAGLNRISEVFIQRRSHDGSDLTGTRQMLGLRSGVLRPSPLLLISPKLRELLVKFEVKRLGIEVAHLV